MQMSFLPLEDRILFRMNVGGRTLAEFRCWVTRRYARAMWQALLSMVKQRYSKKKDDDTTEEMPAAPERPAPATGGSLAMEHEKNVANADFQTAFQESQVFPLGETPLLLSRVTVRNDDTRGQMLCLYPQEGQGIEFALSDQMLHSLCKLLVTTAQKAEWDLNLDFGEAQQFFQSGGLN